MEDGQVAILLAWPVIGGLIGWGAAASRGWSQPVGVIAGAVLGVLSPFLLGVSGISTDGDHKACPHCAERVKAQATKCRHCHEPI